MKLLQIENCSKLSTITHQNLFLYSKTCLPKHPTLQNGCLKPYMVGLLWFLMKPKNLVSILNLKEVRKYEIWRKKGLRDLKFASGLAGQRCFNDKVLLISYILAVIVYLTYLGLIMEQYTYPSRMNWQHYFNMIFFSDTEGIYWSHEFCKHGKIWSLFFYQI